MLMVTDRMFRVTDKMFRVTDGIFTVKDENELHWAWAINYIQS